MVHYFRYYLFGLRCMFIHHYLDKNKVASVYLSFFQLYSAECVSNTARIYIILYKLLMFS